MWLVPARLGLAGWWGAGRLQSGPAFTLWIYRQQAEISEYLGHGPAGRDLRHFTGRSPRIRRWSPAARDARAHGNGRRSCRTWTANGPDTTMPVLARSFRLVYLVGPPELGSRRP